MKEFFRKRLVALKRAPQMIPGLVLVISFLIYSLPLRMISDTTARINIPGMGLSGFVTMLVSMLSFVVYLNIHQRRKHTNVTMLILFLLMQVIVIVCDEIYLGKITQYLIRIKDTSPEGVDAMVKALVKDPFILKARNMLNTHVIFVVITMALTVTLPIYSKFIKKINTSVEVEGNEGMAKIEISGD